jgi:hypothetical protein
LLSNKEALMEITKIEFIQVESSMIEEIAYHDNKLYVRFHNGNLYSYADVPKELFDEMFNAESIGKFFSANIKKEFPFTKLEEV